MLHPLALSKVFPYLYDVFASLFNRTCYNRQAKTDYWKPNSDSLLSNQSYMHDESVVIEYT